MHIKIYIGKIATFGPKFFPKNQKYEDWEYLMYNVSGLPVFTKSMELIIAIIIIIIGSAKIGWLDLL